MRRFERLPHMQKIGCSNNGSDRHKLLKLNHKADVVSQQVRHAKTSLLLNAIGAKCNYYLTYYIKCDLLFLTVFRVLFLISCFMKGSNCFRVTE